LRHRYTIDLPKVLQKRRNLRLLLGLSFPLGPLGLSFPLGLLGPRRLVSQLLSHPLVLGRQHFNPSISVMQRQLSYVKINVRRVKQDKPRVHRPAAVKGTAVGVWPGLRSGSLLGSRRGLEQSQTRGCHRQASTAHASCPVRSS
jgi:hypothetical protein